MSGARARRMFKARQARRRARRILDMTPKPIPPVEAAGALATAIKRGIL